MKSPVFEFKVEGLFRIVVTGDNTDRMARYRQRIGAEDSDELARVEYYSSVPGLWKLDGAEHLGGECTSFKGLPVFFETRYNVHIFVDDKQVTDCDIEHVMASVSDEFEYVPERMGMDGTLDFVNAPGRFELDIAFWRKRERRVVRLTWWVVSEKIDVYRDAELIKKQIEHAKSGFVYAFLTKTRNTGGLSSERSTEDKIWFEIFRSFVDDYKAAISWILHSPHLKYHEEARYLKADRMRRWTPHESNRYNGMSDDRRETSLFRSDEIRPITDSVENRFVKHTLSAIGLRLGHFKKKCMASGEDGVSHAYLKRMDEWCNDLERLRNHAFFRSIGRFHGFRQESLALQRKRGYSKIQETWIALQHAIDVMGKGLDIGNQPIWKLYEFWCFILIRDMLKEDFKLNLKSGSLGSIESIDDILDDVPTDQEVGDEAELQKHVKGGSICKYEFEDTSSVPHRLVTLTYQQSYSDGADKENGTNIVEQIPDIVLTIKDEDQEGRSYTYLFDAKYRIYSCPSRKNPRFDAAPFATLNDMHRYRDAILYRSQKDKKLSREIIGAYVLYPGRCGNSYDYSDIIKEENIGAIPLLPTKYVRNTDGTKELDAIGKAKFEGDDGESALREFIRGILARKTSTDHLGVENGYSRVISTRGTTVVVGGAEGAVLGHMAVAEGFKGKLTDWVRATGYFPLPKNLCSTPAAIDVLVIPYTGKANLFKVKRFCTTTGPISKTDVETQYNPEHRASQFDKAYVAGSDHDAYIGYKENDVNGFWVWEVEPIGAPSGFCEPPLADDIED